VFISKTPTYDIDLELPEDERWAEVIRKEKRAARKVANEARARTKELTGTFVLALIKLGAPLFKLAYKLSGGRYVGEIAAWAAALGVSSSEATLLNCSYELSHISLGCTTGVRWVNGLGMIHVRNMDWPLVSIGNATRLFRFHYGDRSFVSVGITGFVGVLSGMLPGAYSATINWAPPIGRPHFNFGPAFLLREVLETCDSYEEAVEILTNTPLSTSVFFTVCGVKRGQACVIERTRKDAAIRKFRSPVLVQANHHLARKFVGNNAGMEGISDSRDRAGSLSKDLRAAKATSLRKIAAACLNEVPVFNEDTVQKMAFCPKTGDIRIWRLVT